MALAVAIQLVPLAAPLLLSTDAWTYWGYGWIGAEGGGNPYVDPPSAFPESPASPYLGAEWRDRTTVYGPAFTLLSEPIAVVAGDSSAVAAWLFKALAAVAIIAAVAAVARVASRPALAVAFVGWNPVLAVHVAGGGHNDALVGRARRPGAVALAIRRRSDLAGAAWVLAVVRQVDPARVPRPRDARRPRPRDGDRRRRHRGGGTSSWLPSRRGATASTGSRRSARSRTTPSSRRATPSRRASSSSGVPDGVALAVALGAAAAGLLVLARGAHRGEPRLGRAACLVLLTTPYLAVWYLAWAVPLAAADEDRVARLAALALTAYLLPQTIPL